MTTPLSGICLSIDTLTFIIPKALLSNITKEINLGIRTFKDYHKYLIKADDTTKIKIFDSFNNLENALELKYNEDGDILYKELLRRIQNLSSKVLGNKSRISMLKLCNDINRVIYAAPSASLEDITADLKLLMHNTNKYRKLIESNDNLKLELTEKMKGLIHVLGEHNPLALAEFVKLQLGANDTQLAKVLGQLQCPEEDCKVTEEEFKAQRANEISLPLNLCSALGRGDSSTFQEDIGHQKPLSSARECRNPHLTPSTNQAVRAQNKRSSLHRNTEHQQSYYSLTLLLNPEEHSMIDRMALHQDIDILCHAAAKGDLSHAIFDSENFPYLALAALKGQKLPHEDFYSISMHWSILQSHKREEIKTVKLFTEKGLVNLEAKAMLQATMQTHSADSNLVNFNNFTEEQFVKFYERLKTASQLQQQFWIVPNLKKEDGQTFLIEVIAKNPKSNILNQINPTERMIPNLIMVQAYLYAKHRAFIYLKPILGYRDDFISDAAICTGHHCLVSLPYPLPGLCKFNHVDGWKVQHDYDVTYHNSVYCGDIASAIPQKHREFFIMLAKIIRSVSQERLDESDEMETWRDIVYSTLTDLQFEIYQQQRPLDLVTCFCQSLVHTLPANFLKKFSDRKLKYLKPTQENIEAVEALGKMQWQVFQATLVDDITRMFITEAKRCIRPDVLLKLLKTLAEETAKAEKNAGDGFYKPLVQQS